MSTAAVGGGLKLRIFYFSTLRASHPPAPSLRAQTTSILPESSRDPHDAVSGLSGARSDRIPSRVHTDGDSLNRPPSRPPLQSPSDLLSSYQPNSAMDPLEEYARPQPHSALRCPAAQPLSHSTLALAIPSPQRGSASPISQVSTPRMHRYTWIVVFGAIAATFTAFVRLAPPPPTDPAREARPALPVRRASEPTTWPTHTPLPLDPRP